MIIHRFVVGWMPGVYVFRLFWRYNMASYEISTYYHNYLSLFIFHHWSRTNKKSNTHTF